jgi:hypothetical protein
VKGAFASARNYAAARFSPQPLCASQARFELCGRPIAQRGVQSLLVVDLPDEPHQGLRASAKSRDSCRISMSSSMIHTHRFPMNSPCDSY